MSVSNIAKKYLFTRPKQATFSPSSLYSFPPEKSELEHLPLLHLPVLDRRSKRWTGEWTNAYLHIFPEAKYLIIYAHPTSVDIGMVARELFYVGLDTQCNVLLFEYTGYGLSQSEISEETMYADAFSAYWFARSVLKVPRSRIVLMGRSIGSAVLSNLAANLPSDQDERLQDELNMSAGRNSVMESHNEARSSSDNKRNSALQCERCSTENDGNSHNKERHNGVHNGESYSILPLVVLQCPFTDIASCIESLSPIPYTTSCVQFLGLNWFRTIDIIDRIISPVLLHHGSSDKLVPFSHTLQLKEKRDHSERALVTYMYEDIGSGHNNLSTNFLISALLARLNLSIESLEIQFPIAFVAHMPLYETLFNPPMSPFKNDTQQCGSFNNSTENQSRLKPNLGRLENKSNTTGYPSFGDDSSSEKTTDYQHPHVARINLGNLLSYWRRTMSPIPVYLLNRAKLSTLLTLSVSLFSMRCARLWQAYRQCRLSNGVHLRAQSTASDSISTHSHVTSSFLDYFFGSSSKSVPVVSSHLGALSGSASTSPMKTAYISMESKTEFILGCMARWGSPLGVHIGFSNRHWHPQLVVFGAHVDCSTSNQNIDMSPSIDYAILAQSSSACILNRRNTTEMESDQCRSRHPRMSMHDDSNLTLCSPASVIASVAELKCTAGLISAMRSVFSTSSSEGNNTNPHTTSSVSENASCFSSGTKAEDALGSKGGDTSPGASPPHSTFSCFITEEQVSAIQSECERLVAFLTHEEWHYWQQLLQLIVPVVEEKCGEKVSEPIFMNMKINNIMSYVSPQCQNLLRRIEQSLLTDYGRSEEVELVTTIHGGEDNEKQHKDVFGMVRSAGIKVASLMENESMQDLEDFMVQWKDIVGDHTAKSFFFPHTEKNVRRSNAQQKNFLPKDSYQRYSSTVNGSEKSFGSGELANEIPWDYYLSKARVLASHECLREDMPWEDIQHFFHEHTIILSIYKMWVRQDGKRACNYTYSK